MIKSLLITSQFIVWISTITYGQGRTNERQYLDKVDKNGKIQYGLSIIYGTFIQRLAFSSGGFPQHVAIFNADTNETFYLEIKGENSAKKQNDFLFYIKPGFYVILNYGWIKGKLFRTEYHYEPIYKGISSKDIMTRIRNGEVREEDVKPYGFNVSESSLVYIGKWNFSTEVVDLKNEKLELDSRLSLEYKLLDFEKAKINIPD